MCIKRCKIWFFVGSLFIILLGRNALPFSITDALGRTVHFEKIPNRIVLAGRGLLMVADALYLFPEASARLIAIEKITQGKDNFLTVIDPQFHNKKILPVDVGAEQIASARPDVVILKSYMRQKLGSSLENLGIKVVYLDFETPPQYERDIMVLGKILQNDDRAKHIISFYGSRIVQVSETLSHLSEDQKPRVLLLYYSERDGKIAFNIPPASWMQTILVEMAGGHPIWKRSKTGKGWTKVGFEQIAVWNPDQIFITAYFSDVDDVVQKLYADPSWRSLAAVKKHQIYGFPGDYYSWDQPDPRWILGLMWLAAKMHPKYFPDMDIMREVRAFFTVLYGQDELFYFKYIHPMLSGDLP